MSPFRKKLLDNLLKVFLSLLDAPSGYSWLCRKHLISWNQGLSSTTSSAANTWASLSRRLIRINGISFRWFTWYIEDKVARASAIWFLSWGMWCNSTCWRKPVIVLHSLCRESNRGGEFPIFLWFDWLRELSHHKCRGSWFSDRWLSRYPWCMLHTPPYCWCIWRLISRRRGCEHLLE